MTDWIKQGPRYKQLAQEQAVELRRLREERNKAWPHYQNYLDGRRAYLSDLRPMTIEDQYRRRGELEAMINLPRTVPA